jgi:hypothetical protein
LAGEHRAPVESLPRPTNRSTQGSARGCGGRGGTRSEVIGHAPSRAHNSGNLPARHSRNAAMLNLSSPLVHGVQLRGSQGPKGGFFRTMGPASSWTKSDGCLDGAHHIVGKSAQTRHCRPEGRASSARSRGEVTPHAEQWIIIVRSPKFSTRSTPQKLQRSKTGPSLRRLHREASRVPIFPASSTRIGAVLA